MKTSCLVVKWTTICKEIPFFFSRIQDLVLMWNKVALEAYQFANFHVLRCMESDSKLPEIDQTFFYMCCRIAVRSGNAVDDKAVKELYFDESKDIWIDSRNELDFCSSHDAKGWAPLMAHLPAQMNTAAHNHLILNVFKRLLKWIKLIFQIKGREAYQFLKQAFQTPEDERDASQTELVNWLVYYPTEVQIKRHFNHFLKLSYVIARDFEDELETRKANKATRSLA